MTDVPWEFQDLCRTDDVSEDVKEPDPLPFDDWRWQIAPARENANALISRIERDAFSDEVVGPCPPVEKVFGSDSGEQPQSVKVVPLPTPTLSAPALTKFAHKVESLQKRAPEHQRAITDILGEFKKKLGGPKNVEAWDRLQRRCEDVVTYAILET